MVDGEEICLVTELSTETFKLFPGLARFKARGVKIFVLEFYTPWCAGPSLTASITAPHPAAHVGNARGCLIGPLTSAGALTAPSTHRT